MFVTTVELSLMRLAVPTVLRKTNKKTMNNHNELPANEQYPDEYSLSETYRVLERFVTPPGSTVISSQPLTVDSFIRRATKPSDSTPKTIVANNLRTIFGTLFIGGIALGLIINQLSTSFRHLSQTPSLYPTNFVWPSSSSGF